MAAGWLTAGAVVGGYGKDARGGNLGPATLAALKTWALGIPVSLNLKSIKGEGALVEIDGEMRRRMGSILDVGEIEGRTVGWLKRCSEY